MKRASGPAHIAAAALAMVLLGCESPTVSPPAPTVLGTGVLHLTTGPDYDTHDPLRLGFVEADGFVAGEPDLFDAETTIYLDRSFAPGSIHVLANSRLCDGAIAIQPNVEIDAVLSVSNGTCEIAIAATHPQGAISHPQPRTAIGAFVVPDSVLVVRPLDPENTIDPIRKPADEHAEVVDFEVPPGRYTLTVEVNGAVLTSMEIEIKRGQAFYYTLRVVAANVPRICGAILRDQCEQAITAAYAHGGFTPPSSASLRSVLVRASTNSGCYGPPVFDVLFDIQDEPDRLQVTVATLPDGRLTACTY